MMNRFTGSKTGLAVLAAALVVLAGCDRKVEDPGIEFMSWGDDYRSKPDFAQVEYRYPLSPQQLARITPEYLARLPQEKVDQIYARLASGPVPDGPFDGELFFPRGSSGKSRLSEIVGGGLKGLVTNLKLRKVEALGSILWKGKVFYRDEGLLRNRIEDTALIAPLIDGDLSSLQKLEFDQEDSWLLFPARVYCGQSLLDSRRESIIIDYAFTDGIEGYREMPDFLAGRRGFRVRDEIRMVRPGFYLGRAYLDRAFVLNFTLYHAGTDERETPAFIETGELPNDCFSGTRYAGAVAGQT